MEPDFQPRPHAEAVKLITDKPVMAKRVFNQLLPELKARAFTVSGVESANCQQRIRDAVASVPLGAAGGKTWDQAKQQIADELEPYLGEGADWRATLILRTNGFQAFSASVHEAGMADEDVTHFQYLHGECEVPTPSHLALAGVVIPKDDPFWDTHTGPWGHLGCVCSKRPMNPDQVDLERARDATRNLDAVHVIEGPALKQLRHGDILRNGVHYDVNVDGPDNSGFKWSPGDFKIPLAELEKKYDPEVWSEFQTWAMGQKLDDQQTVWDWLSNATHKPAGPAPAPPQPQPVPAVKPSPAAPGVAALADKFKAAKFTAEMTNAVQALPPAIAPLIENLSVESSGRKAAFYSPNQKTIYLKRNIKDWSGTITTMVHEVGHHLHHESGAITPTHTAPEFRLAASGDWQGFEDWAKAKMGHDWRAKLSGSLYTRVDAVANALGYKQPFSALPLADQQRITRFGDTIMGLSSGQYGFGHKRDYMKVNGLKEVFTHAWTGLVDSDAEYSKLFSGVTAQVRRILKL